MKFFIAFAALVAVAAAGAIPTKPIADMSAEIEAIIAAIQSPSTDPATAILLEQQLEAILGNSPIQPEPVIIGPALIEPEPIAIGPEIIDFPLPDGGAVTAPVNPSPVIVGPVQPGQPAPLVQIILNINQGVSGVPPVSVIGPDTIVPTPVIVVDQAPEEVVDVEPVIVVDTPIEVEPVQVVDVAPIVPEPVIIGTPIIPAPAVILPETLN